jgi:hypothetical protein
VKYIVGGAALLALVAGVLWASSSAADDDREFTDETDPDGWDGQTGTGGVSGQQLAEDAGEVIKVPDTVFRMPPRARAGAGKTFVQGVGVVNNSAAEHAAFQQPVVKVPAVGWDDGAEDGTARVKATVG